VQKENNQSLRIGARLKAARERAGLTQLELAANLGFENRQTLASIEAGERRLTAEELVAAVRVLGVDLDHFTDAFRLVGEGRFSYRTASGVGPDVLDAFEDRAGRWVALYRELGAQQGEPHDLVELRLALHSRSTFEEAGAAAESLCSRWHLGAVPADGLQLALERHLRALVLYVDAPPGISGAASQLPGLNTILVNRNEGEGRRNYDVVHETFHLLTWDAMPPERVERTDIARGGKGNRVEQLAESFAAAFLMPASAMHARWESRDREADIHQWLNTTAEAFRVSAVACKWRCHNLGLLSRADLLDVNDQRLVANGRTASDVGLVRPFSAPFVKRVAVALETGRLSAKRAASLLALPLSGLAALLESYGLQPSFEA
jgi:Zn-dependent peptidase ImmA (M78 family)/transcriptional regulator with XRE-family HTH domain